MKINVTKGINLVPQSFITKNKQRLKQYDKIVYLENEDEFQVELFNPTQNKVLASIEIDGKPIGSSGVVLRPGERVFLERFLDKPKKFKFETYTVNGNNSDVQNAIQNNGKVIVKFFNEQIPNYYYGTTNTFLINTHYTNPYSGTAPLNYGNQHTGTAPCVDYSYTTSTTSDLNSAFSTVNTLSSSRNMETGIVSEGNTSKQQFVYDNTSFNHFSFHSVEWFIKPKSTKMVTREDLSVFCTQCGAKRKKDNHKFCPHCGTKY